MRLFRFALLRPGIQRRLFALAISLALPLAAVAGVRALERLRTEQERLAERSLETSRRAAQLLDQNVNEARTLLTSMSHLLTVDDSIARNDSLIRMLFPETSPGFTNIWIADTLGNVRGSLVPPSSNNQARSLGDREYFQTAIRSRRFTVGAPIRSRILSGAPFVLPFATPILHSDHGRVMGVVGASIVVDSLSSMQVVRDLPIGSVVTVLRLDGRVVLRSEDLEEWLARSFESDPQLKQSSEYSDSALPVKSLDGTERLVARATLKSFDGMLYVGIPASATLQLARRQFTRDVVLGLLLTLVVVLVAFEIARRITDPLVGLTEVARALARGDQDRRFLVHSDDEIGVLAKAFNSLADTVQDRERALAESETRYRQLFATNPLPMVTWTLSSGRIEQANDAAKSFYGAQRFESGTLRILDLMTTAEQERFAMLRLPAIGGTARAGVWTQQDAAGFDRQVEIFVGALEREQQSIAVAVMLDQTDRLRAQEELEASREQLRQSQKMEALGSFAGGIAHDFNNYLSAITTNAEMLRDDLPPDSMQRQEASEILSASQRASALTRQILVFSRRQITQEERLDVNAVLTEMQPLLDRLLGERISMQLVCGKGLEKVLIDRGRLEQVMMNLVANSRDAMRQGGVLRIETRRGPDDSVDLIVEDNGDGMPDTVMPRIFEPFFTTKERGKGTGLGLAMVYSIITGARGKIQVSSTRGLGTSFTITLPPAGENGHAREEPAAMTAVVGGSERILLVEDDNGVRVSTTAMLKRAGYRVTAAESAARALELFESGEVDPELLLTDVVMPAVSGPVLAAKLLQLRPELRVLYMSGYADDDVLMEGLERHAINFVAKPFSSADLLGAIRRALETPLVG